MYIGDESRQSDYWTEDRIFCPGCQRIKYRESRCGNCGCPGETDRIKALTPAVAGKD